LLTKIRKKKIINKIISAKTLLFFSIMALITSLYLTYAEFFIIKAICILCVFSQITILGITFSSYKNLKLEKSIRGDLEL